MKNATIILFAALAFMAFCSLATADPEPEPEPKPGMDYKISIPNDGSPSTIRAEKSTQTTPKGGKSVAGGSNGKPKPKPGRRAAKRNPTRKTVFGGVAAPENKG